MSSKPKGWSIRASPQLNELTGDGPNTRPGQDVAVKHTQLQVVFCLLQLSDHLMDELEVALAIANKSVEHLRYVT